RDWSSDVCSSDLVRRLDVVGGDGAGGHVGRGTKPRRRQSGPGRADGLGGGGGDVRLSHRGGRAALFLRGRRGERLWRKPGGAGHGGALSAAARLLLRLLGRHGGAAGRLSRGGTD